MQAPIKASEYDRILEAVKEQFFPSEQDRDDIQPEKIVARVSFKPKEQTAAMTLHYAEVELVREEG